MRVVITGGAGFIGSRLALSLQDEHEVLVVDKMRSEERFSNGNLQSFGHFKNLLDFKGELYVGDISQERRSYEKTSYDCSTCLCGRVCLCC